MTDQMASLKCALGTLKARRERITADLEQLDAGIAALEREILRQPEINEQPTAPRLMKDAPAPVAHQDGRTVGEFRSDIYSTMSVSEAIVDYLKKAGRPQSPTAIVANLRKNGLNKESTNLYRLIYNTLWDRAHRPNPEIKKVMKKWAYREPQAT